MEALNVIIDNVVRFKLENECRAYKNDSLRAIEILHKKNEKFDIIFMDPPYKENLTIKTLEKISEFDILAEDGIIICEHANYEKLGDKVNDLIKFDEREYNKKVVSFFRKED